MTATIELPADSRAAELDKLLAEIRAAVLAGDDWQASVCPPRAEGLGRREVRQFQVWVERRRED